jgi:6-phosphogluconolactonase
LATFLVGGYTADMEGEGTGVGMLVAGDPASSSAFGSLGFAGTVATANSPSWVARHPSLDVVYAALEGVGAVQAFRRTGERSYAPTGMSVPTGELNCHAAVAPDGSHLVAACWGDGRLVRIAVDSAGVPRDAVVLDAARDPYGVRDEFAAAEADVEPVDAAADSARRVSRSHQSRFLPGGLMATTDMGFDVVRFWRGTTKVQEVVFPRGSGPRHTVWHPSGHLYVITELSHEVFALAADVAGRWRIVGASTLGAGILSADTAAELAASRDGEFLYAGVRGSNTIATLRVRGAGQTLDPVALVEAGVDWPRHHLVVDDSLLVAGQLSREVAALTLDARTGVPGRVQHRTVVPSPTCLVSLT